MQPLSPAQIKAATTAPKRVSSSKTVNGLVAMRDDKGQLTGKFLDINAPNGALYNAHGVPAGSIGDRRPEYDEILAKCAAKEYYADWLRKIGKRECSVLESDGRLVKMDMAPTDVHVDHLMPNFNGGYHLADGAADLALPVIVTEHNSNKYAIWDQRNAFRRVLPHAAAQGAQVPEINPVVNFSTYSCLEYALGAFVTLEVQANADAPLQPLQAGVKRVLTALRLEREIRVATSLRTSGNWNSNLVQTLSGTTKWNAGASSDPVANLHQMIEQSAMRVDRLIWSELTLHEFLRNGKVQPYIQYKDGIDPLPVERVISEKFGFPPITTVKMKYNLPSGTGTYRSTIYPYVWAGDVVGIHEPSELPPMSQDDIATGVTFRWNGANQAVRDGEYSGGFLVRTYWDQKRGARGGMMVVVVHNDTEVITSNLVGGFISGAVQ